MVSDHFVFIDTFFLESFDSSSCQFRIFVIPIFSSHSQITNMTLSIIIYKGVLTARQKIKDNKTWQIEFLSVSNKLLGIPIINKKFSQEDDKKEIRLWEITYLDEDLRIMRAKNAKDTNTESFIFVLERKAPNNLITSLVGLAGG